MKKLFLIAMLALCFLGFTQPASANGDVTVNVTYTGPGGVVEGDFAGFKIERDGVEKFVSSDGSPTLQWVEVDIPNPPTGGYVYTATPYDTEGLEGASASAMIFWTTWPGPPGGTVSIQVTKQ